MERRMTGNCHVRCGAGENSEITSKNYLSLLGKIPDFEKVLATMRKFELSAQIILQNLTQLKRLYEKSWEEIPGNCDTTIFLGGKDQSNNEYIMKELGKETIDTLSINKTYSKQSSTSNNNAIMGRELMTQDELATMPNNQCLILVRGIRPFKTDKYDIINHPRYSMLAEAAPDGRNTYRVEEEIEVEGSVELINFASQEFVAESIEASKKCGVTVRYVDNDGTAIQTLRQYLDTVGVDYDEYENATKDLSVNAIEKIA